MFSPLVEHGAGTTAKNVGVIGIGGLGHYAVMFANKMGASVTAISRGTDKADDARALGASQTIATGDDIKGAIAGHERSLDLIICTISENVPRHAKTCLMAKTLRSPGATYCGLSPSSSSSWDVCLGWSCSYASVYPDLLLIRW